MEINSLRDIDNRTKEGKYLMAALAKLTTESQTNFTPDEVLQQCGELVGYMYPNKKSMDAMLLPFLDYSTNTLLKISKL